MKTNTLNRNLTNNSGASSSSAGLLSAERAKNITSLVGLPRVLVLSMSTILVSSCVSSTLETAKPDPIAATSQLALSEEEQNNLRLRSEGIAQIHAKADAAPVNKAAPAYGLARKGETDLLTTAQINAKINNVATASQATKSQVDDAELAATHAKMLALQKKGSSHYESALVKIEKE